ncbi:MAG: hypothetical protein LBL04_09425 [Bacteroidales bacterium]|nr:hypothetical protein [Bacteroidales bacterium]
MLKFVATLYGRIRKDASGGWSYDYFLKDHLGNVRAVLEAPSSSAQSNTILYMATMEESKAATEDLIFNFSVKRNASSSVKSHTFATVIRLFPYNYLFSLLAKNRVTTARAAHAIIT